MKVATSEQMQNLDRKAIHECGIPGIVLMENAGRGAVQVMNSHFPSLSSKRVAVLCGRGNNGGDGFVIARCLIAGGTRVKAYLLSQKNEVKGDAKAPIILTPHPGEMARLMEMSPREVQNDRLGVARACAAEFGCHVILKGARTIVSMPSGEVFINPTGNPGMASGGTGDVLTGMIGGFLCQGLSLTDAARVATYLHGLTGDVASSQKGERSLVATDLIDEISILLRDLGSGRATEQ